MYELTEEQKHVVDRIAKSDKIVLVKARAGCTKTSTSLVVVDTLKPKKALYTAFNRAIIAEGKEKFTSNVECRTLHSLALSYVRPKLPIEDLTYLCIKEKLSYPDKKIIINVIDDFYRSDSSDMYEYMDDILRDKPKLIPIAIKYINLMVEDKVNPSFNFLLKLFHLFLVEGTIDVKYDLVIMDELQDSTQVALEIFKLIDSPKKLGLGDNAQAIFGFMNLVDGFDILTNTETLGLTHSFRVEASIATKIETFSRKYIDKNFIFEGTETPVEDGLTAYITATNAEIVMRLSKLHKEGKRYTLTRSIKDIFACPLALTTAAAGKEVYHKRYKFLEKEYRNYTMSGSKSFFSYLKKEVKDDEIKSAIDVLMKFKANNINVWDVLKEAKGIKPDKAITVGTFFSLKGLEFSTVYIENDLNSQVANIIEKGGPEFENDLTTMKGAYVASSRCRKHLHNCLYL